MRPRIITIIILFITIHISCSTGKGTFNDFYQQNKYKEGVITFEIPSFFFHYLLRRTNVDNETGNQLLHKIKGIQVYISERATRDEILSFERILDTSLYSELMVMRDGPSLISFKIREGHQGIEEILFSATGEKGLFILSVKGRFSREDVKTLIDQINLEDVFTLSI